MFYIAAIAAAVAYTLVPLWIAKNVWIQVKCWLRFSTFYISQEADRGICCFAFWGWLSLHHVWPLEISGGSRLLR